MSRHRIGQGRWAVVSTKPTPITMIASAYVRKDAITEALCVMVGWEQANIDRAALWRKFKRENGWCLARIRHVEIEIVGARHG